MRVAKSGIAGLALAVLGGVSFAADAEPADVIRPCAADSQGDRVCTVAEARPVEPGKFRVTGPNEIVADTLADAAHDAGAYWDVELGQTVPAPVTVSMDGFVEQSDGNGRCCLYVDVYLADGTALYTNVAPVDRLISAGWNTATVTVSPPKPIRALRAYALLRKTATRARFRPPRVHVTDARELRFDGLPVAPVDTPLAAGFYVRDVAAKTGFAPIADGETVRGVRLAASCETQDDVRRFDVTLAGTEARDRAVTLVYAVPLPAGDLVWHDHVRASRPLAADGLEASVAKDWNLGAGGLSRGPFGAVTAGGRGFAVGLDNSAPAYFRTVANPKLRVLFIAFDLGLAPEKRDAHLRFCVFPFDGAEGYRGALEAYRAIFPDDFRVRIREHGQWMAFMKIADVPGWEDFGFRIMEGTEALSWDDAHGMLTFRYTEPGTWWMKMQPKPGKTSVDLADALEEVKARAAQGDAYAKAWEASVTRDANGNPGGRAIDTPWCKGYVWSYNSVPGVRGAVTDFENKIGDAVLEKAFSREPPPNGLDGEYVDSADLYCTETADYDRRHFAAARTPLCFDQAGRPVVFKGLACYEYVRSLADRLWPRGRYVMVNSAPRDWCWLMPYADVGGDEVNWMGADGWKPPAEDFLVYKLAAGCGKPMNFLMNTPRKNLTHARVEQYMKRMLAYGFMPGLNGKTDGCHYYSDKEMLERDRDLHRKYVPLCRRVSEAGWRPVNRLTDRVPRPVVVEQFGENLLTVLNDEVRPETVRLRLKVPCAVVRDLVSGRTFTPCDGSLVLHLDAQDVMVLEFVRQSSVCIRMDEIGGVVDSQKPYLIVNEDNDHYLCHCFREPSREALELYVDGLTASGRVTHLVFCACGQRASFDSKAWEPIWKAQEEKDANGKPSDNAWIRNAKALKDAGIDLYEVWIARCRQNGVSPWLSMRMNDAHGATDIGYWRNTTFWRTRRDLWRAADAPNMRWNTGDYIFDFVHAEVRDYTFAMAEELLTRYAADGLELDFTRHHLFFRAGHEREDAHFMTDLVRRISAVARARGRKLAVRVPDTLVSCRAVGLDVVKWAKEGLIDAISPGSKYWIMTFALPLREWTEAIAAVNPNVLVIPGTDKHIATEEYVGDEADAAAYRGWAANMYGEGAKGLYLFNAIYHPKTNRRDPKLLDKLCSGLLDPAALGGGSYRFIRACRSFYPRDPAFNVAFEGPHVVMLPRTLPVFASGRLILGMGKGPYELLPCRPRLNSFEALGPARFLPADDKTYHGVGQVCSWEFPKEAFRGGTNLVTVTDCAIDHGAGGPKLTWCEIALDEKVGR